MFRQRISVLHKSAEFLTSNFVATEEDGMKLIEILNCCLFPPCFVVQHSCFREPEPAVSDAATQPDGPA